MNSAIIKQQFSDAGIKVRVKAFGSRRFRICRLKDAPHTQDSQAVAASLGLVNSGGHPGGDISQPHEMFANVM